MALLTAPWQVASPASAVVGKDTQSDLPASLFLFYLDLLGSRLENEGDSILQTQACLCYICAGNVDKLVACWTKVQDGNSPLSLQVGNSFKKGVGNNKTAIIWLLKQII